MHDSGDISKDCLSKKKKKKAELGVDLESS